MFVNCKTMRSVSTANPDITSRYYKDIRRLQQLSSEEQLNLIRQYNTCTDANIKNEIRDKLMLANQAFIISIARHLATEDDFNDLISEGNIGMAKAIEAFDITKDNKFLTYAAYYVRQAMTNYQYNIKRMIKPKNAARVYAYSETAKNAFFTEYGRFPTDDELLEKLAQDGVVFSNKEDLHDIVVNSIDTSFNSDASENTSDVSSTEWFDNVCYEKDDDMFASNVASHIEHMSVHQMVEQSLSYLTDFERSIVSKYYGIGCRPMTSSELAFFIGKDFDSEKVEKFIKKCIKKIRRNGKIQTHVHRRTH